MHKGKREENLHVEVSVGISFDTSWSYLVKMYTAECWRVPLKARAVNKLDPAKCAKISRRSLAPLACAKVFNVQERIEEAPVNISIIRHNTNPYRVDKMMFKAVAYLLAGASILNAAVAHNIQLRAHSRECFHEDLHKDDKMTVTFQVGDREFGGSGNLDIDFFVRTILTRGNGRTLTFWFRSSSQTEHTKHNPTQYHPEITHSRQHLTVDTPTASATNTGQPTAKKSPSMFTV